MFRPYEQTPFSLLIGSFFLVLNLFCSLLILNQNEALAANFYTVILDPGHGGTDTGAQGTKDGKTIYEKEITLALAKRVEWLLKDKKYWKPLGKPIKVIYTRKKDIEVTLQERSRIAQSKKADLFLSIHANAESSGKAHGIETFFLKNDEKSAAKLAEIQNRGGEFAENHGFAKIAKDADTALLLNSVAADATVDGSKQAAELINRSVSDHLKRLKIKQKNRGVKQALLFVLLNAQTPAVLFEAFYLSHPEDLDFISSRDGRQKTAEGIVQGILRFLILK